MKKKRRSNYVADREQLSADLNSADDLQRAKAVRALCPCREDWELFEQYIELVRRLRKAPSPLVRAAALHVLEDTAQIQSDAYPTHRRQATNEMLRTKRRSRFPASEEDLVAKKEARVDRNNRRSR